MTPVMSDGSRSGWPWTRDSWTPSAVARARASTVLPTPGTSSMSRWLPDRAATTASGHRPGRPEQHLGQRRRAGSVPRWPRASSMERYGRRDGRSGPDPARSARPVSRCRCSCGPLPPLRWPVGDRRRAWCPPTTRRGNRDPRSSGPSANHLARIPSRPVPRPIRQRPDASAVRTSEVKGGQFGDGGLGPAPGLEPPLARGRRARSSSTAGSTTAAASHAAATSSSSAQVPTAMPAR